MASSNTDLKKGVVGNLGAKAPCRVCTTTNIDLEGLQTINGITIEENDRILVRLQDDETENGIYIASTSSWERAVDFDDSLDGVPGSLIFVNEGSGTNELSPRTLWVVTCDDFPIDFGTSEITFTFFAIASETGTYLSSVNNLSDVANPSASLSNIGAQPLNSNLTALSGLTGAANKIPAFTGVGTMALLTTGASSGNVPLVGTQSATTSLAGTTLLPQLITIANNSTDANNDIDFSAGNFQFDDGGGIVRLTAIIKRLDANWAAGTNQGGLDTGSKANSTWYYCYAIYNPTTSVSDAIFTATYGSPTMPSGYTKKRYVGSIRTNSSGNILAFTQKLNRFSYLVPIQEHLGYGLSTGTGALIPLTVPVGKKVTPLGTIVFDSSDGSPQYVLTQNGDGTPTAASSSIFSAILRLSSADNFPTNSLNNYLTNTSSQIRVASTSTNTSADIIVNGFIDYDL